MVQGVAGHPGEAGITAGAPHTVAGQFWGVSAELLSAFSSSQGVVQGVAGQFWEYLLCC